MTDQYQILETNDARPWSIIFKDRCWHH